MLKFENVSLSFADDLILDNVSFTLNKKERCGLVGRNGSGKSSLLKLITKEIEPSSGSISIPTNYKIGYLTQYIKFTQSTVLKEACLALPKDEKDNTYLAEKILSGLDLSKETLILSPTTLSGGYQLRLHLAKVLISQPNCLLLDEPTNYLDIVSIRWLKNFLKNWKEEFIFISHDREFTDSITNSIMGIHRKKTIKIHGKTSDYYEQIYTQEMVYEKTRLKNEKQRKHLQDYIDRFGAKATKASQAGSKKKLIEKIPELEKLIKIENLSFSFHEAEFNGKNMLFAKNLYFSYTDTPLIQNFSCEIDKGERIAIIGKNGYGKSTILKLLAQDIEPKKGTLRIKDNIKIGYFGQTNINKLNDNNTIEEEISSANIDLKYSQVKQIAANMMFSKDSSTKKIAILSGGEKSRVLLGKILSTPCNLLLLDEPTHHLDIESIEALLEAIEKFTGSIVIVTHSELILQRLHLHKIIICEKSKQTLFFGNYEDFLTKIGWEERESPSEKKTDVKEKKKSRAMWIAKRSEILSPLKKEIQEIEEKIEYLEKQQKEIIDDFGKKTPSSFSIKLMGENQKLIDNLYSRLDKIYKEFEKEKEKFNRYIES